jgi:hypothetical protein
MIWLMGCGVFAILYSRWLRHRQRGQIGDAVIRLNDQPLMPCAVRVASRGLSIAGSAAIWTIPWPQVAEGMQGSDWWTLRLASGDFLAIFWETDAPRLGRFWP